MSENQAGYCAPTDERTTERDTTLDRWLDERPMSDASLPSDMATIMSRFYSVESVETLDDFVEATRAEVGGSISLKDLCHVARETPHIATTANETYYFRCFYDGVALAYLADDTVDIRTESPAGTGIEIQATSDGEIDASPPETVMSFGIGSDVVDDPESIPTVEAVYGGVCPYVKAFPSRERYKGWAAGVDAATVGLPLTEGIPIAAALTGET